MIQQHCKSKTPTFPRDTSTQNNDIQPYVHITHGQHRIGNGAITSHSLRTEPSTMWIEMTPWKNVKHNDTQKAIYWVSPKRARISSFLRTNPGSKKRVVLSLRLAGLLERNTRVFMNFDHFIQKFVFSHFYHFDWTGSYIDVLEDKLGWAPL